MANIRALSRILCRVPDYAALHGMVLPYSTLAPRVEHARRKETDFDRKSSPFPTAYSYLLRIYHSVVNPSKPPALPGRRTKFDNSEPFLKSL
ncbi:hypothetical protein TRIP_B30037 [uncultured Desulfatiglans sp.]|uniref:Uncharacterized protein n=1 Tax=Uncultured Desulfatiglans sp. TaxID=1748965 RepID=A0A653A6A8_UNCDX|nr:hypothetical protein TRIP_B30037 [uncultured Desulfatiglans sp.]